MISFRLLVLLAFTTTALPAWAQILPPDLPVTFDDPTVDYTVTDFEGTVTILVPDPLDAANTVASTIKQNGAEPFAGSTLPTLASPIPFTASETTMSVRVYSPGTDIPVRLRVEETLNPMRNVVTETLTTTADAWETLVFDFDDEVAGSPALNPTYAYDQVTIFFNFGISPPVLDEQYLWDDVAFGGATGPAVPSISRMALYTLVPGLLVVVGLFAMRRQAA